jgi:hypothetical protein
MQKLRQHATKGQTFFPAEVVNDYADPTMRDLNIFVFSYSVDGLGSMPWWACGRDG